MTNRKWMQLIALFVTILVINTFAMRMTPEQLERGKVATKNVMTQMKQKTHYFIHEQDNPENGIWIDKKLAKDNSQSIKNMVEDLGEELTGIPLPCSLDAIKLGFDLLGETSDISKLSEDQLIDVANLFNFLDVPTDKMQAVLLQIKKEIIDKNGVTIASNKIFKNLHPDLQKVLLADTSDDLKNCIIKKYAKNRAKSLVGHPKRADAAVFSPDGTKIISCSGGEKNCLLLWDVSNSNNITHKVLAGPQIQPMIGTVAFSPDGRKIVSGSHSQPSLVLWNISDLNKITHEYLDGTTDLVMFNPDGKSFIARSNDRQNIVLWNINDPNNIIPQIINSNNIIHQVIDKNGIMSEAVGNNRVRTIESIAFNPDGKSFITVNELAVRQSWDLRLCNISDLNDIADIILTPQEAEDQYFNLVAFLPDGKRFVSCGGQIILWDISDLKNVSTKILVENLASINIGTNAGGMVNSLALSHDGKTIVLGHNNGFTLLDINDPSRFISFDNIVVGFSLSISPDDRKIVTTGLPIADSLKLWTLVTDHEEMLLKQIKDYNADQIRLVYQLCLQSYRGQKITLKKGSEEEVIFKTLPQDMQKLLNDLFSLTSWFSGWWG